MARRKKQPLPTRLPVEVDNIDELVVNSVIALQVAHAPKVGRLGLLQIAFGTHFVDLLVTEDAAETIIDELEDFLKGRSPDLAFDNN